MQCMAEWFISLKKINYASRHFIRQFFPQKTNFKIIAPKSKRASNPFLHLWKRESVSCFLDTRLGMSGFLLVKHFSFKIYSALLRCIIIHQKRHRPHAIRNMHSYMQNSVWWAKSAQPTKRKRSVSTSPISTSGAAGHCFLLKRWHKINILTVYWVLHVAGRQKFSKI